MRLSGMQQQTLQLHERNLRAELLPQLIGRVFHVTTIEAVKGIVVEERVRWDAGTPRYANAYCRSISGVSVCDLRVSTPEQIDLALDKYYFLDPTHGRSSPAFLFLNERCFPRLIPGRRQMEDRDLEKLVVPYIEACHPGDIPVAEIDKALCVEIQRDPPSPFLEALRSLGGPR